MNDDLPWTGPRCGVCGRELDPEPMPTSAGMGIAYTCPAHGAQSLGSALDEPAPTD